MTEEEFNKEFKRVQTLVSDFKYDILRNLPEKHQILVESRTLRDVIERVHKRKHYYDEFHNLPEDELSQHKIIGLYIYWILKLRPIISDWHPVPNNNSYDMNDIFAWYLFKEQMENLSPKECLIRDEYSVELHNEILYSFRYRDMPKESVILLFEPFVAVKRRQNGKDKN